MPPKRQQKGRGSANHTGRPELETLYEQDPNGPQLQPIFPIGPHQHRPSMIPQRTVGMNIYQQQQQQFIADQNNCLQQEVIELKEELLEKAALIRSLDKEISDERLNYNNARKSNELMKNKLSKLIENEANVRRIADEATSEVMMLRKEIETEKRMRRLIESNTKSGEAEKVRLINAEGNLRTTIANLEKEVERYRVDLERERRMRSIAEANSKRGALDNPKVKDIEATYIKALEKKGNELERSRREFDEEKALRAKAEKEIRSLKKEKEVDIAKINSMSEQINAVIRDKKTSWEKNGELVLELQTVKDEMLSLQQQYDDSLNKIDVLEQRKVQDNETNALTMNQLQDSHQEREDALQEEIVKAQVEINVLKTANQCLDREKKDLNTKLSNTEKSLVTANKETTSLQGRVSGLETKVSRLEEQVQNEQKLLEEFEAEAERKLNEAQRQFDELNDKRNSVDRTLTNVCEEAMRAHDEFATKIRMIIEKLSPTLIVKGKIKKRKIKKQDTDQAYTGLKEVVEEINKFKVSILDGVVTSDGQTIWKIESNEDESNEEMINDKVEEQSHDIESRGPVTSPVDDESDFDD